MFIGEVSPNPSFFLFGWNGLTEADLLLVLIEEANYNYENIEDVVQAKIDEAQKQLNELKAMSQEQFL